MVKDFFISYNKADREMATWIDRWLKEAGFEGSYRFQEKEILPRRHTKFHEAGKRRL